MDDGSARREAIRIVRRVWSRRFPALVELLDDLDGAVPAPVDAWVVAPPRWVTRLPFSKPARNYFESQVRRRLSCRRANRYRTSIKQFMAPKGVDRARFAAELRRAVERCVAQDASRALALHMVSFVGAVLVFPLAIVLAATVATSSGHALVRAAAAVAAVAVAVLAGVLSPVGRPGAETVSLPGRIAIALAGSLLGGAALVALVATDPRSAPLAGLLAGTAAVGTIVAVGAIAAGCVHLAFARWERRHARERVLCVLLDCGHWVRRHSAEWATAAVVDRVSSLLDELARAVERRRPDGRAIAAAVRRRKVQLADRTAREAFGRYVVRSAAAVYSGDWAAVGRDPGGQAPTATNAAQ
jgi:hypothetical protein